MQIKPLIIISYAIATASAVAIPQPGTLHLDNISMSKVTDEVPDITLSRHQARTSTPTVPLVRGNVPDITDLSRDIVAEEYTPPDLTSRQTNLNALTDNLIFSMSLPDFLAAKATGNPAGLNWTDNGCSKSPDKPFGFNFLESCMRHDFGYRNFKAQGRFTEANRKRIDDRFLNDLLNMCENDYNGLAEGVCKSTAHTYHTAVRAFGNL